MPAFPHLPDPVRHHLLYLVRYRHQRHSVFLAHMVNSRSFHGLTFPATPHFYGHFLHSPRPSLLDIVAFGNYLSAKSNY